MDQIADALIRIKNASLVRANHAIVPLSKTKLRILTILKDAGYIDDVVKKTKKSRKSEYGYLEVALKYVDGLSAISGIRLVSKPSRHAYVGVGDIKSVRSGFGMAVISTSKGIMTSKQARKEGVGGEVLFEIW